MEGHGRQDKKMAGRTRVDGARCSPLFGFASLVEHLWGPLPLARPTPLFRCASALLVLGLKTFHSNNITRRIKNT
jgi:hypothetical protein